MAKTRNDTQVTGGRLSAPHRRELLRAARRALEEFLTAGRIPPHDTDSSALLEHRGAFVSLPQRDSRALRGCLGEFLPRRPLIESVTHMAVAAATRDPRFRPVTAQELPEVQIEISALTPLHPIRPQEIQLGVHGLMIVKGEKRGLLLPQVPPARGWDREDFLTNLCLKTGLATGAWRSGAVELLAFETELWRED